MIYTSPLTMTPLTARPGEPIFISDRHGVWTYRFRAMDCCGPPIGYSIINHSEHDCCPAWSNDECRCGVEADQ